MTTPETPEAHQPAPVFPVEKIRAALLRYRVMAWTTGIWLIALCYEIVSHFVFHQEIRWIGVVHGWVYFVYVLTAFNLAVKVRWPIGKTIGVMPQAPSRCWASSSSTSRPGTSRRASGFRTARVSRCERHVTSAPCGTSNASARPRCDTASFSAGLSCAAARRIRPG